MGCYINPLGGTKEQFLMKNGKEVWQSVFSWEDKPENCLPVVLVDNKMFTAAGVCYSKRELEAFTELSDLRPKRYFYVAISALEDVSPIEDYLKMVS